MSIVIENFLIKILQKDIARIATSIISDKAASEQEVIIGLQRFKDREGRMGRWYMGIGGLTLFCMIL